MLNTYKDACDYLDAAAGMSEGLARIDALLDALGRPDAAYDIVHVAGTNGKGSVTLYVACALSACGYRVGRYSSPAVFHRLETVTVNGQVWSEEAFTASVNAAATAAQSIHPLPTRFEIETAAALLHFAKSECDIVVLETGLGGKSDATNAVRTTKVAAITSIGLDHTAILGDTLEAIAKAKCGIVKRGTCAVSAPCGQKVRGVLTAETEKVGAPLIFSDVGEILERNADAQVIRYREAIYVTRMLGDCQAVNLPLALDVLGEIRKCGYLIEDGLARKGIETAKLSGRFEIIHTEPTVILDGAHNPDAANTLKDSLRNYFPASEFVLAAGVFGDKDIESVAEIMAPIAKKIVTFHWNHARAAVSSRTAEIMKKFNPNVIDALDPKTAVTLAYREAEYNGEVMVIFGSLSHLAETREWVEEISNGRLEKN